MSSFPPGFEAFAREPVKAGHVVSEEKAVAAVLRNYLAEVEKLRALMKPAVDEFDRDEGVDGDVSMQNFIAETPAHSSE